MTSSARKARPCAHARPEWDAATVPCALSRSLVLSALGGAGGRRDGLVTLRCDSWASRARVFTHANAHRRFATNASLRAGVWLALRGTRESALSAYIFLRAPKQQLRWLGGLSQTRPKRTRCPALMHLLGLSGPSGCRNRARNGKLWTRLHPCTVGCCA